jgi:predicted lipid-binding transport protein (Tim44 family)
MEALASASRATFLDGQGNLLPAYQTDPVKLGADAAGVLATAAKQAGQAAGSIAGGFAGSLTDSALQGLVGSLSAILPMLLLAGAALLAYFYLRTRK